MANLDGTTGTGDEAAAAAARLTAALRNAKAQGYVVEFCTDADLHRLWLLRHGEHSRPFGRMLVLARCYGDTRRLYLTDSVLGEDTGRVWLAAVAVERATLRGELDDVWQGSVMVYDQRDRRTGDLRVTRRIVTYKAEVAPVTMRATGLAVLGWAVAVGLAGVVRLARRGGGRVVAEWDDGVQSAAVPAWPHWLPRKREASA